MISALYILLLLLLKKNCEFREKSWFLEHMFVVNIYFTFKFICKIVINYKGIILSNGLSQKRLELEGNILKFRITHGKFNFWSCEDEKVPMQFLRKKTNLELQPNGRNSGITQVKKKTYFQTISFLVLPACSKCSTYGCYYLV